jgi:hypothetical protein
VVKLNGGSPPSTFSFDLAKFVATSPMMTSFHNQLPNQPFIDKEVAAYNALVARGFIGPVTDTYFLFDLGGVAPTVPIPATDSAGTAHNHFNNPPVFITATPQGTG